MTTEVLLIRHGQVDRTESGSGREDPPLTSSGRETAEQLARRLAREGGFSAIYTSPLRRARETAEILASDVNLEPKVMEALQEFNFRWETSLKTRLKLILISKLWLSWPVVHLAWFRDLMANQWASSPAIQAFVYTVTEAIQQIVGSHLHERVIIVAHGGTITALLVHFFPSRQQWGFGVICNFSLTRLALDQNEAKLLAFNDTSHLQK